MDKVVHHGKIFYRYDKEIGLFAYNTINGLTYAISKEGMSENDIRSLSLDKLPSSALNALFDKYILGENRLLPDESYWPGGPQNLLNKPLVINWLITNKCTHRCNYCYANDVINNDWSSQSIAEIESISESIISQKPLNVVLSGGEPLLQPYIKQAILNLGNRVGITIDTNGFCTEKIEELVPVLKKYNIHVRVSLDTLRIKNLYKTRPVIEKIDSLSCLERIFNTITLLIDNNINLTLQTVLTCQNSNDLLNMGDKIWKIGIKTWRIFELQKSQTKLETERLCLDKNEINATRKNKYFFDKLNRKCKNNWGGMNLLFTPAKGDNNNVIMVLPDGKYYTQGKHGTGKILIDPERPYSPSQIAYKKISWSDHFERYIQ